jgi:PAS fold
MRSLDWSETLLGPVSAWPQSLRTSVSTCLNSRFAILIWWGPDLVMLYNDAYRDIIAAKHPAALGRPGRECWPEIWHIIGPMLEGVLRRGDATWSNDFLLLLERNGYPEECYFTFSYSPIRDESGGIGGVFTPVAETTEHVIGGRRMRTLRDLASRASGARDAKAACKACAETLAGESVEHSFCCLVSARSVWRERNICGRRRR